MNNKMCLSATVVTLSSLASVFGAEPQKTQRPNIVLIIGDDCRMRDLGCYGNACSITPNIDRLAAQGLRFEQFFQATAMSSPTRQCMLTGLYPVHSGAYPNHTFIGKDVVTLPSYLKDAGYRVATQGKRHYAPLAQFPFEYIDDVKKGDTPALDPKKVEPFIRDVSKSGEPFFLYLCSIDPHSPWTRGDQSLFDPQTVVLPSNFVDTPATRRQYCNYLAEINLLDRQVGQIDALLDKYGLTDNTVFIFTSEQGYSFPYAKWTCYDEGLQTGVVIRWPGVTKPGSTTSAMCEYVDMTPTLVDIASGKEPAGLDGKSFKRIIEGKSNKGKKYVFGIQTSRGIFSGPEYYAIRSVRDNRYSYIVNITPEAKFSCTTLESKFWKEWEKRAETDRFAAHQVERYVTRPAEELYDNLNDPFQTRNLADDPQYAKVKKRMQKELAKWMKSQGDQGQATEMEALKHMASKMGVK